MGLDESCFVGLKIFFGIEIVGILLDLMSFSFLAVVDTLFQVIFDDVHFGDDALDTHELVGKFAGHSPWSHEVRSQVAFKTNIVVLDFILESPLLFSLQISFE